VRTSVHILRFFKPMQTSEHQGEMTMAKKSAKKLRVAKSVKPMKSLKIAANHNEVLLRH
jgi:hypothetical protein